MPFSEEQIKALEAGLPRSLVAEREGSNKMKLSYIPSHVAIRTGNRIFGFHGWQTQTLSNECVYAGEFTKSYKTYEKKGYLVAYKALVRVTVTAEDGKEQSHEGTGFGIDFGQDPASPHEKAMKEAESDAEKRALRKWGDQFGLALYDKEQEHVVEDDDAKAEAVVSEATKGIKASGPISPEELQRGADAAFGDGKPAGKNAKARAAGAAVLTAAARKEAAKSIHLGCAKMKELDPKFNEKAFVSTWVSLNGKPMSEEEVPEHLSDPDNGISDTMLVQMVQELRDRYGEVIRSRKEEAANAL